MSKGSFAGRRRELEDVFFLEHDVELLKALREEAARKERKKALAEATGITSDEILDHLHALDVCGETLTAVSLIPLIVVAWADGSLDAGERRAVLDAAQQEGLQPGHPGYELLQRWLARKLDARLLPVWKGYVSALCQSLDATTRNALKRDLLGRARTVAEAAGGLLGLGRKISASEQAVLDELAATFE